MNNNSVEQTLGEIQDLIMKAAETTSTYTFSPATRSVFSPQNLDEEIKFLVPTDTPLRNRIPRTPGKGQAATWKRMTSGLQANAAGNGGPSGTNVAISFADAGAPGDSSQNYDTKTAVYKLLGRKLEVGGLALAASKGREDQPDMQKSRERVKMYEVMLGEEELLIAGDSQARSNEFDGLNVQITTNSGTTTFLTASGVNGYNRSLYGYGADPTLLVASARQLQALADDLERTGSIQRVMITSGEGQAGVTGGLALTKLVNSVTQSLIDVKPSRYVGYNALLLTEKSPAGENWLEVEELIPVSRVDVPSSNFSYISFIVEALALKVIAEPYQFKVTVGA